MLSLVLVILEEDHWGYVNEIHFIAFKIRNRIIFDRGLWYIMTDLENV